MLRVVTIGVYGFDQATFLAALEEAGVGLLLDVRRRRGVRGREYAWANSIRLQSALTRAGIEYRHHRELAPSTALLRLQHAEDARRGVGKRTRVELAPLYRERYTREILDRVDLAQIVRSLPTDATTALLCVERDPEACHRSLIAGRMAAEHGLSVRHVTPP
jgi:uncharacterized protein (DUF488 family)